MLRIVRLCERLPRPAAASRHAAVLVLAMAAGGCSAGFEMPTLSYSGGPSSTSSVPIPREPVYSNRSGSLGDARGYGESSGQPYGQPYSQPYAQPYSPPNNGGYDRPYNPPYEHQGASQSPYQAPSPYQPPYQPSHQAPPRQEWRESNRGTPVSPVGERGVRVAGLPEAYDSGAGTHALPPPSHTPPPASIPYRSVATVPVTPPAPPRAALDEPSFPAADRADGSTIEVASGDTLYALSKKHGVPVSELMRANNLTGPQLRVGQKLAVPSGREMPRRVASLPTAPVAAPAPLPAASPAPFEQRPEPRLPHHEAGPIVPPLVETDPVTGSPTPAAAPAATPAPAAHTDTPADDSGWTGTYTVARGDNLYTIARKHNVRLNELERANKIIDPRRVRPGTVLKVPRVGDAPSVASASPTTPASSPPASASSDAPSVAPKIINARTRTRTASLGSDTNGLPPAGATDAPPPAAPGASTETPAREAAAAPKAAAAVAKFRWPARGKIISSFGEGQNDGINIALPRGTDVHAAEAGVVTYAGDGVQGYGNLLLIRHDGGWITAYAHNDSLAVKAGESVRRGQVVAKAGATGSVDTPQLRFEIRKGVKPVDPVQHLEN